MNDRSQRKWIIAWSLFWGAFGLTIAILIYTNNPHTSDLTQKELTQWLLTPVIVVITSVVIGGIFGFELHDWRLKRRTKL